MASLPFSATLSWALAVLVYAFLFRGYAWRATLSLRTMGLIFAFGCVGATIASLYFQTIPQPFVENIAGGFRPVMWTTGPIVEEVFKALPIFLLLAHKQIARRLSVVDFALTGFLGGLGFAFVERNFQRLADGDVHAGWSNVWNFGYDVQTHNQVAAYWPGHHVYTALVGLAFGIGVVLWRDSWKKWIPGLCVLAYATLQHQLFNYLTMNQYDSLYAPLRLFRAATGYGGIDIIILPVAMIAVSVWETHRLRKHGTAAPADLLLPGETGPAVWREVAAVIGRLPAGRRAVSQAMSYFSSRRAVAIAEAEALLPNADPVTAAYATQAHAALAGAREQVIARQVPPGPALGEAFKLFFKRYRLILAFGLLAVLLFAMRPGSLGWLHGPTARLLIILVSAGFVAWRIWSWRKKPWPQPATARGDAMAAHRLQLALLCTSVLTVGLTLTGVLMSKKWLLVGDPFAFIYGHMASWASSGGSTATVAAVGAAIAAGLAAPVGGVGDDSSPIEPGLLPSTPLPPLDEIELADLPASGFRPDIIDGVPHDSPTPEAPRYDEETREAFAELAEITEQANEPAAAPAADAGEPVAQDELPEATAPAAADAAEAAGAESGDGNDFVAADLPILPEDAEPMTGVQADGNDFVAADLPITPEGDEPMNGAQPDGNDFVAADLPIMPEGAEPGAESEDGNDFVAADLPIFPEESEFPSIPAPIANDPIPDGVPDDQRITIDDLASFDAAADRGDAARAAAAAEAEQAAREEAEMFAGELETGPIDPNSPRGVNERAKAGDPDAIRQLEEWKTANDPSMLDDTIESLSPLAHLIGADTIKELPTLDWAKEVAETDKAFRDKGAELVSDAGEWLEGKAKTFVEGLKLTQMDDDEISAAADDLERKFDNSPIVQTARRLLEGGSELASMDGDEFKALAKNLHGKAVDVLAEKIIQGQQLVEGMTTEEALGHIKAAGAEGERAIERLKNEVERINPDKAREVLAEGTYTAIGEVLIEAGGGALGKLGKVPGLVEDGIKAAKSLERAGDVVEGGKDALKVADGIHDARHVDDFAGAPRGPGDTQVLDPGKPGGIRPPNDGSLPPGGQGANMGPGDTQVLDPGKPGGIRPPNDGSLPPGGQGGNMGPGDTQVLDPGKPGGIRPPDERSLLPDGQGRNTGPDQTGRVDSNDRPSDGYPSQAMVDEAIPDEPVSTRVDGVEVPKGPKLDPDENPLPGGLRNPLREVDVGITGLERDLEAVRRAPPGADRDKAIEDLHKREVKRHGIGEANINDQEWRDGLSEEEIKRIEGHLRQPAPTLEDLRRRAGLDPTPPARSPAAAMPDQPQLPPVKSNDSWTDAETGGKPAAAAPTPRRDAFTEGDTAVNPARQPAGTGPTGTERIDRGAASPTPPSVARYGDAGVPPAGAATPAGSPASGAGGAPPPDLPPRASPGDPPMSPAAEEAAKPGPKLSRAERMQQQRTLDDPEEFTLEPKVEVDEFDPAPDLEPNPEPVSPPAPKFLDPAGNPSTVDQLVPGKPGQLDKIMGGRVSPQNKIYADTVNDYAQLMIDGKWDWKLYPNRPIIEDGTLLVSGNHRMTAAELAAKVTGRPLRGPPSMDPIIPEGAAISKVDALKRKLLQDVLPKGDPHPFARGDNVPGVGVVPGRKPPAIDFSDPEGDALLGAARDADP